MEQWNLHVTECAHACLHDYVCLSDSLLSPPDWRDLAISSRAFSHLKQRQKSQARGEESKQRNLMTLI